MYVSLVLDPEARGEDVLSILLSDLLSYASPPCLSIPIIGKVLKKAGDNRATILSGPLLANPCLISRASAFCHIPLIKLLLGPESFLQPRSSVPHGNPGVLDLHPGLLWVLLVFIRCPFLCAPPGGACSFHGHTRSLFVGQLGQVVCGSLRSASLLFEV